MQQKETYQLSLIKPKNRRKKRMKQLVKMVIGIGLILMLSENMRTCAADSHSVAEEIEEVDTSEEAEEFDEVDSSEEEEQKWMPPEEMSETEYETLAVEILEDIEFTNESKTFLTKDELEKMENVYVIPVNACLTRIKFDIAGNHYEKSYEFMCEIGEMARAGIFEEYIKENYDIHPLYYYCPTWQEAKLVIGYANGGFKEEKQTETEIEAKYEEIAVDILEDIEFFEEAKTFFTQAELEKMENVYISQCDGCLTEVNFDIAGNHYEAWYDFMYVIGEMADAGIFEEYIEEGDTRSYYHCPTWQEAKLVIGYASRGYAEKKKIIEEREAKNEAIALAVMESIEFTKEDGTKTYLTQSELEKMKELDIIRLDESSFITFYIDNNQYKARIKLDLGPRYASNWELAVNPIARSCMELIRNFED